MSRDSLVLLSQEYPMLAVNSKAQPQNGIVFGDPYMNLVLRSFAFDQTGMIKDVDEHSFALEISEPEQEQGDAVILQCYPNPALDLTTIRFNLVRTGQILLEVYDLQGNRIATLLDQVMAAGHYEIDVDVSPLKPGTYICRLQAGDNIRSLKLIVGK
jgi:hypothetical protein